MTWQSTPWADPLLASTVVSATLAVFGLLYDRLVRHDRRVVGVATVMIGTAVWTLGYSFQFASADIAGKQTWAVVAMVGETTVPVAWCTFALIYARREEWLTRRRVAALWVLPAVTIVLTVTNGSHGLVWTDLSTVPAVDGDYLVLDVASGPWMAVHGAYSYLAAFAGVALIIDVISRARRIYRGQAAVLLAGIVVPAGANIVSLTGIGPGSTVDLTPPSMAVLGVAFAIAIFRYQLFDLIPVARSAVVENMSEGYVLLDDADEIVDLNAAARSLLDGMDGRLIGRDATAAFGADLSVLDAFEGDPVTETITVGPPSEQRYVDVTVSRVEAAQATGRLIVVRDVTGRIRVQRRFQTLIEASSDIVFVLDETGRIEYVSPSVESILGYDPAEIVGETSFEALVAESTALESVEDAPSTAASTWRRLLDDSVDDPSETDRIRFAVDVRTAGGDTRTIEAIARYLVDDPAVEGIVINARDITERKERELMLERTNERLDRFASFVSHDLRNPLNVAMGRLDLAMESGDEGDLRTVQEQHERMSEMIDDLLTMAREGGEVSDPVPVDVDAVATRAWNSVETGGASFEADTDLTVLGDESRLANLFENLFRNSVEHGSTGSQAPPDDAVEHGSTSNRTESGDGVEHRSTSNRAEREDAVEHGAEYADPSFLTVWLEALDGGDAVADGGGRAGFAVSDDGVGISAAIREEVTESGYTTEDGNTGYGLAIVDEIATAHDWALDIGESRAGGARFVFTDVEIHESGTSPTNDDSGTVDDVEAEQPTPGGTEGGGE